MAFNPITIQSSFSVTPFYRAAVINKIVAVANRIILSWLLCVRQPQPSLSYKSAILCFITYSVERWWAILWPRILLRSMVLFYRATRLKTCSAGFETSIANIYTLLLYLNLDLRRRRRRHVGAVTSVDFLFSVFFFFLLVSKTRTERQKAPFRKRRASKRRSSPRAGFNRARRSLLHRISRLVAPLFSPWILWCILNHSLLAEYLMERQHPT